MLFTCSKGLLFKYTETSMFSLLFLLVTTITSDFCSLKVILFYFAQFNILLISTFAKFSASHTVFALTALSKSSALVRFPKSKLSNELN
jgi:hypothetical protein